VSALKVACFISLVNCAARVVVAAFMMFAFPGKVSVREEFSVRLSFSHVVLDTTMVQKQV
jgi:hypothetical protein